ncbi:MAG: radical SAM protein, partial [Bacteroidota bacterium]
MKDSFNRSIDYVRIAVTDRCNLRCFYCMPKEGIPYEPKSHLLSYEEITRLLGVLGEIGFKKVRFTGGEPFLRKDFIKLLENTASLP